jgi:DNA-binding GntR family transcriptional regulator
MKKSRNRIPNKVLKEIFPQYLKKFSLSDDLYAQLKALIRSGKLKKGQKLALNKLAHDLDTTIPIIRPAFQRLEREGLIISMGRKGSFVT